MSFAEFEHRSAADYIPPKCSLAEMQVAVQRCKGCDLYKDATQAVFGEGRAHSKIILVGEQPGAAEDIAGRPFVGPAGRLLDKALAAANIERNDCYVTNVVKHFKYEWKGKRRIHSKPRRIEVLACLPWLISEIETIKPKVIVCMGATSAQALLGTSFRVSKQHGVLLPFQRTRHIMATLHPSAILRAPTHDERDALMQQFAGDLANIKEVLE